MQAVAVGAAVALLAHALHLQHQPHLFVYCWWHQATVIRKKGQLVSTFILFNKYNQSAIWHINIIQFVIQTMDIVFVVDSINHPYYCPDEFNQELYMKDQQSIVIFSRKWNAKNLWYYLFVWNYMLLSTNHPPNPFPPKRKRKRERGECNWGQ